MALKKKQTTEARGYSVALDPDVVAAFQEWKKKMRIPISRMVNGVLRHVINEPSEFGEGTYGQTMHNAIAKAAELYHPMSEAHRREMDNDTWNRAAPGHTGTPKVKAAKTK